MEARTMMNQAVLTADETRVLSIWGMLGKRRVAGWRWVAALVLAGLAWLGSLAFIAQYRATEVWGLFAFLGAKQNVYLVCLAAALLATLVALLARRRDIAALMCTGAALLAGLWLSTFLYRLHAPQMNFPFSGLDDALGFSLARLWYCLPSVLMLGLAAWLFRKGGEASRPILGVGDWGVEARDANAKEPLLPYWRRLVVGFVIFTLVLGLLLQASVGFKPITSGKLLALAPAILLAALVNATVEEMIYRGFLMPAFIRVLGAGAGMWVSGILFGVAHWGLSVGVLAALPISLLIGFGAVIWGKAAYETKGLGWPIAAHFLVDIAIMSAYFA
jgi:membrane protease YdiL (CAAX protease family)